MRSLIMPGLLELQRSFSAALLSESALHVGRHILEDGFSAAARLRIYRNTCRSPLLATLRMTYPPAERLVGGACREAGGAQYSDDCPGGRAPLMEGGHDFAERIAGLPSASSVPNLADVA